ncbi:MAG: DNA repair protein RecN [Clostridia bacterium]|nr:DNA repair protein RecN [Clostridia bacterium]
MLASLHIENVAVIRSLDLDLAPGFTVLTGETGAGKSVILDSINLLLGGRFSRELIRTGETRATVSGLFCGLDQRALDTLAALGVLPDEEGGLLLQKTVTTDGRSQTRLNGQSITLALQREIARVLLCINGQHEGQALLQKSSHLALLDAYAGCTDELAAYRQSYAALQAARKALDAISLDAAEKTRRAEMLAYQIADIDAVKPKVGEEDKLTRKAARLQNLEKISRNTSLAARYLSQAEKGSAVMLLERSAQALRQIADVIPEADELAERLDNCRYEVADVADRVMDFDVDEDGDPTERLNRIEGRLDALTRLKRKYGADEREILAFRAKAAAELETLNDSDERAETLRREIAALEGKAADAADALRARRMEAAERLREQVLTTLSFLDMPKVRFAASVTPMQEADGRPRFAADGADDVEFMLAANPGEPLLPMAKIASGGELSRILLALKRVLADRDGVGTIVFDEIDTGISGKTARKIGLLLSDVARGTQVLCVTHSAQVASMADAHCLIAKHERNGRVETAVTELDEQGRIGELARIMGGIEITDVQREAAAELLHDRPTMDSLNQKEDEPTE